MKTFLTERQIACIDRYGNKPLIGPRQAAGILGIKYAKVLRMLRAGQIVGNKDNPYREWVVETASVMAALVRVAGEE